MCWLVPVALSALALTFTDWSAIPTPPSPQAPNLEAGMAEIETMEIVVTDTTPVQVYVKVTGNLPDTCTQLGNPSARFDGTSAYLVELPTTRDPGGVCAESEVPYEVLVPLDVVARPAGTYTVTAGDQSGEFTLLVDNVMSGEASFPDCPEPTGETQVFVSQEAGFCLLYPVNFEATITEGLSQISGPPSGGGPEPLRATLVIDASGVANGRTAAQIADEVIAQTPDVTITRSDTTLGGEPAVILEGVPGRAGNRQLITVRGDRVYWLTLSPVGADAEPGAGDADLLD
jgi:inhibitor of cysteine peptidase